MPPWGQFNFSLNKAHNRKLIQSHLSNINLRHAWMTCLTNTGSRLIEVIEQVIIFFSQWRFERIKLLLNFIQEPFVNILKVPRYSFITQQMMSSSKSSSHVCRLDGTWNKSHHTLRLNIFWWSNRWKFPFFAFDLCVSSPMP